MLKRIPVFGFFFLLLVGSPVTTIHAQGMKETSAFGAQQGQCCVCSTPDGGRFKVPHQGNSSCSIACAASGGTAAGTAPCYVPPPSYPAKYEGPTSCLKSIDGGDCKGNNWCHCGKVRVYIVKPDGQEYPAPNATVYDSYHIHVGETLRFHASIHGWGGTESGGQRVALQKGASIMIGPQVSLPISPRDTSDGDSNPPNSIEFADYKFDKPGTYQVYVQIWGAFKWNSDSGSCSYECENKPGLPVQNCPPDANLGLAIVVEEAPMKVSP